MFCRRADFYPSSCDAAALTADLVWSTGADVERRDKVGSYLERLRMDAAAVDLSRLRGAPLLNAHQQRDLADVLGVITDAAVDGKTGTATVRFSERARPIFEDVASGILRSVSVGYSVAEWSAATEGGRRVRIATRWQPLEISLVPIGADPSATVRERPMDNHDTDPVATRAETDAEIRRLCQIGGADPEGIIELGGSIEDARRASLTALVTRGQAVETRPAVQILRDYEDPSERASAMADGLLTRIDQAHQPGERGRQYAHMGMRDLAVDCLRHAGVRTTGLATDSIISRALHTTSDFPLIMGDTVGRVLKAAYSTPPSGVRSLAKTTTVPDFRAKTYLAFGDYLALEGLNEHGEFRSGTIAEDGGESVRVATYGKIFGYTRQLMVNDDLGALQRIGAIAAASARQLEADLVVDLLTSASGAGPLMADSVRLFHASHGNLTSPGSGPLSVDELGKAVLAMRTQTGISGRLIDVSPTAVLVPAALEAETAAFFGKYSPHTAEDYNPFRELRVLVDPRLDAKSAARWYIVAEGVEGLISANLEGNTSPVVETKAGFEVDGVQIRVRHDFGCAFIDHRGWHANSGQ